MILLYHIKHDQKYLSSPVHLSNINTLPMGSDRRRRRLNYGASHTIKSSLLPLRANVLRKSIVIVNSHLASRVASKHNFITHIIVGPVTCSHDLHLFTSSRRSSVFDGDSLGYFIVIRHRLLIIAIFPSANLINEPRPNFKG